MKHLLNFILLTLLPLTFLPQAKANHNSNNAVQKLININSGSGNFKIRGGYNHEDDKLNIYYHKPKAFNANSQVLIVIPGAGRNGDDYRDSWVEAAEKYNVLILSPSYSEKDYDFSNYHMAGLINNFKFNKKPRKEKYNNRYVLKIDDEDISYDAYNNSKSLIFSDFDRLFDIAIKKLGTNQSQYDIFGHSAGGQIAHRLALFKPNTKVNRILASNSGSYTAPVFETKLPFGIQDAKLSDEHLKHAFKEKLTLFIGELDNENGTGGTLLHSPTVNKQGLHRYARAQYFYKTAKKAAKNLNTPINWQLKIIPNIGHNYRLIGKAAAEHLYANL